MIPAVPGRDGYRSTLTARADRLVHLRLGIIPVTAQRTVWPLEAFYLHDDTTLWWRP